MVDFIYKPGKRGDIEREKHLQLTLKKQAEEYYLKQQWNPNKGKPIHVTQEHFETKHDEHNTFPFYEDENGYGLYGFGKIDPTIFANHANLYYEIIAREETNFTPNLVKHGWAVAYEISENSEDWEWTRLGVNENTPHAFIMTWIDF